MCLNGLIPYHQSFFAPPAPPAIIIANETSWSIVASRVVAIVSACVSSCVFFVTGSPVAALVALASSITLIALFDGCVNPLSFMPTNSWALSSRSMPHINVTHHQALPIHHPPVMLPPVIAPQVVMQPPAPSIFDLFAAPAPRLQNRHHVGSSAALPTTTGIDLAQRASLGRRDPVAPAISSLFSSVADSFFSPPPASSFASLMPDVTARAPVGRRETTAVSPNVVRDPHERAALGSRR